MQYNSLNNCCGHVAKGGYRFFRLYLFKFKSKKSKDDKKKGERQKDNPWANKEGLFVLALPITATLPLSRLFVFVSISCFLGTREREWSLRSVSLNFKCNKTGERAKERGRVFLQKLRICLCISYNSRYLLPLRGIFIFISQRTAQQFRTKLGEFKIGIGDCYFSPDSQKANENVAQMQLQLKVIE